MTLTIEERLSKLESQFGKKIIKKQSDYNVFVKKYIADNKKDSKNHRELFSEAAKAWSASKK